MSSLTKDTQIVYTVLYYYHDFQKGDIFDGESGDFNDEDDAIINAQEYIERQFDDYGRFAYGKIEKRVVPIYR